MSEKEDALEQRKSDATSDETLSEVEETGQDKSSSDGDAGPSPDGRLDEPDELKDADAM